MEVEETPQRLTNDDFRKLLMTPRAPASGSSSHSSKEPGSAHSSFKPPSEARRKKKNFYAQLKKQEDTKSQELADKYRDRARERRDGANPDYQIPENSNSTSAYRAVAPDMKSGFDAAERKRQMIQESKFLGGDMEHTHLVKGLDYALLQKVRSEIVAKEHEQEEEMEKLAQENHETAQELIEQETNDEVEFKTIIGKNLHRIVQMQKSRHIERNDLFLPGRMAYNIELDDDNAESEIPTTIIRSRSDIPIVKGDTQTLTTNDIVINKLAQILSYLRQGGRGKKNKKRDKDKPLFKSGNEKMQDDSIYGDIGDYRASRSSRHHHDDGPSSSGHSSKHDDHRSRRGGYFEKSNEKDESEMGAITLPPPPKLSAQLITKLTAEPEGYAECYPGLQEMNDAIDDSDDEVDYTKMDLGNKKGPVGRWDFDTQEEYSDYMSSKEALPKAAFQYGVKMQDGRKTRKHKTEKNEKAELDREWQQIQNIMNKRKTTGSSSKGGSDEPEFKVPKY